MLGDIALHEGVHDRRVRLERGRNAGRRNEAGVQDLVAGVERIADRASRAGGVHIARRLRRRRIDDRAAGDLVPAELPGDRSGQGDGERATAVRSRGVRVSDRRLRAGGQIVLDQIASDGIRDARQVDELRRTLSIIHELADGTDRDLRHHVGKSGRGIRDAERGISPGFPDHFKYSN